MIKNIDTDIGPIIFEKIELSSWSFTCDKCGVLIGTCFDFGFNDDWAVKDNKVNDTALVCGKCQKDINYEFISLKFGVK